MRNLLRVHSLNEVLAFVLSYCVQYRGIIFWRYSTFVSARLNLESQSDTWHTNNVIFEPKDVTTSFWRNTCNDVIITPGVCREANHVRTTVYILIGHYNDVIMGAMASQITSLTIVYSTVYSVADQRKYQSSASLAFVRGIHRWPVNSPHKGPATRKMFPFDDVIMWSSVACCANVETVHAWLSNPWHMFLKKPNKQLGEVFTRLPLLECTFQWWFLIRILQAKYFTTRNTMTLNMIICSHIGSNLNDFITFDSMREFRTVVFYMGEWSNWWHIMTKKRLPSN